MFSTGQEKIVADLLDGDLANVHMGTVALGIRHVLCTPLRLVRYLERADQQTDEKRIGVLYLDSREKGALLSRAARTALETLATEAAVAIENARLYREALEKAQDRAGAEDRGRDPAGAAARAAAARAPFFDAVGQSVPCRSIGGDFFDYVDLPDGAFGFAVGDVAGKGAPAALLTAVIQGVFSSQAQTGAPPSETLSRVNQALIRRAIESRFCTAFYAMRRARRRAHLLQRRPQPADGVHRRRRDAPREGRPDPRPVRARDVRGGHDPAGRRATCSWPSATASPRR